jgi:hypothetical protein
MRRPQGYNIKRMRPKDGVWCSPLICSMHGEDVLQVAPAVREELLRFFDVPNEENNST